MRKSALKRTRFMCLQPNREREQDLKWRRRAITFLVGVWWWRAEEQTHRDIHLCRFLLTNSCSQRLLLMPSSIAHLCGFTFLWHQSPT